MFGPIVRSTIVAAVAICGCAAVQPAAFAEGALAIGITNDVGKDGIAYGTAINYKTVSEAREIALRNCRTYKEAPKAAAMCRLVSTVKDLCFAVAFDPKDNEPGVGWAIAATEEDAERRALDDCMALSSSSRRPFCKVDLVRCDGKDPPPRRN